MIDPLDGIRDQRGALYEGDRSPPLDIDKLCAQARARLKHWIGTKAGKAKAKVAENGYQEQYALMLEEEARKAGDGLYGFRDRRGPAFDNPHHKERQ